MNNTVNRDLPPLHSVLWIIVGILATVVAIVLQLTCATSCDEQDTQRAIDKYAPLLGQVALDAYQQTRTDPQLVDAYADGGWDGVKSAAPRVYLSHLKAAVLELGISDDKLKLGLYELLREYNPDYALVVQRDGPLGPEGLWPWIEDAARSAGYPGVSLGLLGQLTPEEWDWFAKRFPLKVVEEIQAVRALKGGASVSTSAPAPADAQPSDGIREEEWTK